MRRVQGINLTRTGPCFTRPRFRFWCDPGYEQWRIPKIVWRDRRARAGVDVVVFVVVVVDRRDRRKLSVRLCVVISDSPYLDKLVLYTSRSNSRVLNLPYSK